jgi:hypothetical protein
MATPTPAAEFLWENAGAYGVAVTTLLTTELNSLGFSSANTLSSIGNAFQNTNARLYCDIEFLAGGGITTAAGAFLEVWFLRSLDGGTNYEDGTSSLAPGRGADVIIPVRAGTNITPRAGMSMVVLPPGFFKPIARNQVTTLPASSNVVRYAAYSPGY